MFSAIREEYFASKLQQLASQRQVRRSDFPGLARYRKIEVVGLVQSVFLRSFKLQLSVVPAGGI